ncbi:MAG: NAD(P)/FAD-dependent oxidoreductase [Oscillibacter sp.]|jgi:glycerol-3-phosphate dehydrogenase|nr:NAD(P)/FAD-dependent oxidoreductase [Oscillibacter sp.]
MQNYDVIIVGGGAVGCAVAYTLSQYDLKVALLERNGDVAMGTSGKNSAVVHAGFNNRPGSLMAHLCVDGNQHFAEICHRLDVPYRACGKLVVGFDDQDMEILRGLVETGRQNGCRGLELIDQAEMQRLEPGMGGVGAMFSKSTAITNPFLYTIHLCEAAMLGGVECFMNQEVCKIEPQPNGFAVLTQTETYRCKTLINAAGLYSDKVAAMAGDDRFCIYPCRGEYLILDQHASTMISRPIYPAPHKGVGGLGVHLTTTMSGNVLIGPNAEYIDDKNDYATKPAVLEQLFAEAQQLCPQLTRNLIIGQYTGIRSKLVAKGEKNFGDFIIEESDRVPGLINLIGIESPGLTASLPIARMVADIIGRKQELRPNGQFQAEYRGPVRFREQSREAQDALIAQNPDYGEIVCRCESVTKAEIVQALHNPLGAHSIVSIKNRLRATMGRCQGGYCTPKIVNLMMEELGVAPQEIDFRHSGDMPFPGRVK